MKTTAKKHTYTIVSGDNDAITSVEAANAKEALRIWQYRLYSLNPYARRVRAIREKAE